MTSRWSAPASRHLLAGRRHATGEIDRTRGVSRNQSERPSEAPSAGHTRRIAPHPFGPDGHRVRSACGCTLRPAGIGSAGCVTRTKCPLVHRLSPPRTKASTLGCRATVSADREGNRSWRRRDLHTAPEVQETQSGRSVSTLLAPAPARRRAPGCRPRPEKRTWRLSGDSSRSKRLPLVKPRRGPSLRHPQELVWVARGPKAA